MAKPSKRLGLGRLSAEARRLVITVSRVGIAARGIVFIAIALLMARAARQENAAAAGGLADALRSLGGLGRWPYAAIATGLVAYGVYELLNARYRNIRVAWRCPRVLCAICGSRLLGRMNRGDRGEQSADDATGPAKRWRATLDSHPSPVQHSAPLARYRTLTVTN